MNARYFSIIGYSGSGKTFLIERIIDYLVKRNYKVGVIKSMHHPGFGIDIKDKDTTKYGEAGAVVISYVASESAGIIYRMAEQQTRIFRLLEPEVDYIILEGFKVRHIPQIALLKEESDLEKLRSEDLIGVYSHLIDLKTHALYVPIESIPKLVEERAFPNFPNLNCGKCGFKNCEEFYRAFLKGGVNFERCVIRRDEGIIIKINDELVPLNKFTSNFIKNTINGMLSSISLPSVSVNKVEIRIGQN